MTKKTAPIAFEKSLAELEALVEKLEQGDVPLEDALKNFERGVQLTRECQSALKAAQQKVEILLKKNNSEARLAPFDTELDDDGAIDEDDDEDAR
jgi:exodeoxyribonuclease VII small subunit